MTEMVYGVHRTPGEDPVLPRWWRTVDQVTLSAILILFGIGVLLGLAASPPLAVRNGLDEPFFYVERQLVFGAVALSAMFLVSMMNPDSVRRWGVFGFFVFFAAVAMLPILGTDFDKGATRWYSLGFGSLQPSEFLKPCFVVITAWLMAASDEINGPPGKAMSLAIALVIVAFLIKQPDFGQAALIIFAWCVLFFIAGARISWLVGLAALVVVGGFLAYNGSEHFARRIDGFLAVDIDPNTQIGYATNAIREGGILGVGVGEGQVKWSLPDAHTDFIIAVAAEEYGLMLVLLIIALILVVTVLSLFRLMRERDTFIRLAGTGLVSLFAVQAFINMAVAVRLLPAKGMTLPFVSYGGSSLLAGGIAIGMLLAFTRTRPQGEISDHFRGR